MAPLIVIPYYGRPQHFHTPALGVEVCRRTRTRGGMIRGRPKFWGRYPSSVSVEKCPKNRIIHRLLAISDVSAIFGSCRA